MHNVSHSLPSLWLLVHQECAVWHLLGVLAALRGALTEKPKWGTRDERTTLLVYQAPCNALTGCKTCLVNSLHTRR